MIKSLTNKYLNVYIAVAQYNIFTVIVTSGISCALVMLVGVEFGLNKVVHVAECSALLLHTQYSSPLFQ